MANYARDLPRDKGGSPMNQYPAPFTALARTSSENATVSSVITVTDNTTALEVTVIGGSAVLKWIAASDTQASVISAAGTANYDHVLGSTVRRFVIPQELALTQTSVVGANVANGLYKRYAIKSIGIASVLTSEF